MSADTIGGNLRDQFQQFTKNIPNGPNNNTIIKMHKNGIGKY